MDERPGREAWDAQRTSANSMDLRGKIREAGFYGWPYVIADNKVYRRFNFASGRPGDFPDLRVPINDSPNNMGIRILPPARGAFMWYPYSRSEEFPLFGLEGGRSAMAGPVFRQADQPGAPSGFPAYFEGRLFVHEWMRHRIFTVKMTPNGSYEWMETFLPEHPFSRPIDMEFGPDGSLYVLEYGEGWNTQNEDARLSRIAFED